VRPLLPALATTLAFVLATGTATADDLTTFERGVNSYEGERYKECIDRFSEMLRGGAPTELKDKTLQLRARMYLATCLFADKREPDAEKQMEKVVVDDPRFFPDRAAFPAKIIDRFTDVRGRMREEIDRLERERLAKEEEERREREEAKRREAARLVMLERLAREELFIRQNSRWVALAPFGVGQFQNNQRTIAWSLLGTEVALAGASIASFVVKEGIEANYQQGVSDRKAATDKRDTWVTINHVSFAAFAAVALGGIVHAQLTFVPEVREIRERKLPRELFVTGGVTALPGGGAAAVMGRF
jgi:hypothetical protein